MSAPPPSSSVELRWAAGEADRRQALRLREEVFCDEQGVPRELEVDGLDDRALHLLALPSGGLSITSVGAAAAEATGPSTKAPATNGAATSASTKPVTALLAM